MPDDLDVRLRESGEQWRRDVDASRAPVAVARRRPSWMAAAAIALVVCLAAVGVVVLVAVGRRAAPEHPNSGRSIGVRTVTSRELVTIDRSGHTSRTRLGRRLDLPAGPSPFRMVGSEVLGLVGRGADQYLVAIGVDGRVRQLVLPAVSGYAISWDQRRIAWSEPHRDGIGYVRSTDFVEATYPGLVELHRHSYADNARIDGYVAAMVYFDAGDGASGRAGIWSTRTDATVDLTGGGLVVAANAQGRIVVTEGDGTCAQIGTMTDQVMVDGQLTGLQPLDCRGLTAVSPDGTLIARLGRTSDQGPLSIEFYRFSDGGSVGLSTPGLTGSASALSIAWANAMTVVVRTGSTPDDTITKPSVTLTVHAATGGFRRMLTAPIDPQSLVLVTATSAVPTAPAVKLDRPEALAVGTDGRPLVWNQGTSQILRLDAADNLQVVAGSGITGYAGDGGPAVAAELGSNGALTVTHDGTVYFADTDNHRIRAISPNGLMSTVAGNGSSTASGTGGPATQAGVPYPYDVTVGDDGRLWIVDSSAIRYVTTDGTIHEWLRAGGLTLTIDGSKMLFSPTAIALDTTGHAFVYNSAPKVLVEFSSDGRVLNHWDTYLAPAGIAALPGGGIVTANYGTMTVDQLEGNKLTTRIATDAAPDHHGFRPSGVAAAADGTIYATTDGVSGATGVQAIWQLDTSGLHRLP